MRLFIALWLCPTCGRIHKMEIHASESLEALNKLMAYLRDAEGASGNFQPPIGTVFEVPGDK